MSDYRRSRGEYSEQREPELTPKELRRQAKQRTVRSRKIGYVLVLIQLLVTVFFDWILYYLDLLEPTYTYCIIGLTAFLVLYVFLTQLGKKRIRMIGKVLSCILIIVLGIGSYYLFKTYNMFDQITGVNTKTDTISIIVLKDDAALDISDLTDYNFGISQVIDRTNTDKALADLADDLKKTPDTTEYADFHTLVQALYDQNTKVIILNEAYRSTIEDDYPDFSEDTRVIKSYQYKTKLATGSSVEVTEEPFVVYLCGNDQTGTVTETGRSDVNICAVVNPKTGQILLVSTPRDAYVELKDAAGTVPAGSMDKLTHASNFGVDSAIKTLNNLYQIDISHYIRVNFTGFESIVDAIGGITIDSPYSFTSVDGFYYPQGVQDMNGKQALNYARERKAFTDGDLQRNKNQTQVLQAILNKVLSPSILTSYGSLMDSVPNAFLTSLTKDDISSLVKLQQSSNIDWDILSYNVLGTTGNEYVYSISSFPVSVVYLDETDVANATSLMQRMLNGERITQTEIDALSSNTQ